MITSYHKACQGKASRSRGMSNRTDVYRRCILKPYRQAVGRKGYIYYVILHNAVV